MNTEDDLIALFGMLAPRFGLSRPAGQIFAAVWYAERPPTADDLVGRLGISRSNVSTALKELRSWSLVSVVREPGVRREFFAAPRDPWQIARILLAERRRREIEPAKDRLSEIALATGDRRLKALAATAGAAARWLETLATLEPEALRAAIEAGPRANGTIAQKKTPAQPIATVQAEDDDDAPSVTVTGAEPDRPAKKKKKKNRKG